MTFRLREGMFCRDAKGQKVGPMISVAGTYYKDGFRSESLWHVNGNTYAKCDAPLVAEWIDTPAADEWSGWMPLVKIMMYMGGEHPELGKHRMEINGDDVLWSVPVSRKAVKREKVEVFSGNVKQAWGSGREEYDTHRISFDLVNGVPDCSTIKMEEL